MISIIELMICLIVELMISVNQIIDINISI